MPKPSKVYRFNRLDGCVVQRVARQTGTLVGLYHNAQAGFDEAGGAWSTVCEAHHACIAHETLALARAHLSDPTGWCNACADERIARHKLADPDGRCETCRAATPEGETHANPTD